MEGQDRLSTFVVFNKVTYLVISAFNAKYIVKKKSTQNFIRLEIFKQIWLAFLFEFF